MAPNPPHVRSAPAEPWRSSIPLYMVGAPAYELGPRSIDTGCQRRRPDFSSTPGFTHERGQRPVSVLAAGVGLVLLVLLIVLLAG